MNMRCCLYFQTYSIFFLIFFTFHLKVVDYKRAFPKVWASFSQIMEDLQYIGVYKGECEIKKNKNAGTSRLF